MASRVGSLGEYLREQRRNAELTLRQLAEQTGLSNPYLSQIENGLRRPSAEVLQRLAAALRVSSEALYVRAGLLEQRDDDHVVETAISSDLAISERQKRVLLDIYASFRREHAEAQTADAAGTGDAAAGTGDASATTAAPTDAERTHDDPVAATRPVPVDTTPLTGTP